MTSFSEQLKLLLWKNWILRKRHKTRVVLEFVWPLILFLVLMWVRTRGLKQNHPSCHVVEKALPSVGGFEFFQNYFCTLNNTCYDEYVENDGNLLWKNALFVRLIDEAVPLLKEIVSSPEGKNTVQAIWKDVFDLVQIIGAFSTKSESGKTGNVTLGEMMGPYSRKAFIEVVSTYTTLSATEAKILLGTKLNVHEMDKSSFRELLEHFNNETCYPRTTFKGITFANGNITKDICEFDYQQKQLLAFFVYRYMDKEGFLKQLKRNIELNNYVQNTDKIAKLLSYDMDTIANLLKLKDVASELGTLYSKKFFKLNSTELFPSLIYEGMCGVPIQRNSNSTTFGFDPGAANRFDSLRDKLKDWNPDHHYEPDPDISQTCNYIFRRLESIPFTALLWRQVKPLLRGVIYFAPKTPFTEEIMQKVDMKFAELQGLEQGAHSLMRVLHRLRRVLRTHSEEISQTLIALNNEENLDLFFQFLGVVPLESQKTSIISMIEKIISSDVEVTLEQMDFAAELLSEVFGCVKYNKTKGFDTEWEAVNEGSKLLSSEKLWAVIAFENVLSENGQPVIPKHLKYKIRMDSDKVDGTRYTRDRLTSKTPRRRPVFDLKYVMNGFAYLQELVEHSIIETVTEEDLPPFQTFLQQFPYPCYIYDQFIRAISRTFPLFMVLSWVYASAMIVKSVVMEKELRLREVMKVMGLGNGVIWTGWFIDSFAVMSVSATMLTVILKYGNVIENSDVTLLWVFMISYTVATICFSFLVSCLFSRANSAAAAGGIMFFISYLPYNMLLVWEEQLTWYHIMSSCLISNVAFGFGCTYFARYEEDGVGGQWSRITMKTLPGDDFNLSFCIIMLWVDSVLYCFLTWYIEALFPGPNGVPKPWNFFLKGSYWRGRTKPRNPVPAYEAVVDMGRPEDEIETAKPIIEAEPEGLQPGVVVTNLTKRYSNGKLALDDLSISFYENQITSFLGHNGAGKTTTISILTGLFPPTSGTARIYGLDITKDMDSIRKSTGICPQYNTLFDRLTVKEHMQFYAGLKGKYDETFDAEFEQIINDLGIPHKKDDFPKNLSGGMKRKLSVACSFIGGSTTIFLDEPTSGVDPYSRRSIWELLLKYKEGRTIILTTHFMDEADILGDRIAIISQGKLKAVGSSLFLKSHYGQGYSLRLVRSDPTKHLKKPKTSAASNSVNRTLTSASAETTLIEINGNIPGKQIDTMNRFVQGFVQDAVLVDDVGSEVVFLLPYPSIKAFPTLFQSLDQQLEELGFSTYGISDTTLEDVFLKITIADIEDNIESFSALDGKCKRRVVELLKKIKRKKAVQPGVLGPAGIPTVAVISDGVNANIDGIEDTIQNGFATPGTESWDIDGNLVPPPHSSEIGTGSLNASLLEETSMDDYFPARSESKNYSCCCLAFIQIGMIFLKRLWNSNRNKKAMFFEIILPAVFIAITLAFTLILPPATDEPPRELSPWTYPSPNLIFFSDKFDDAKTVQQFESFTDGLLGREGMGTACLDDELYRDLCKPDKRWSNITVDKFQIARRKYVGQTFEACNCKPGTQQCPASINNVQPPKIDSPTGDMIYDVSKINIPEWIEKTYRAFEVMRFGGFEMQLREAKTGSLSELFRSLDILTSFVPLQSASSVIGRLNATSSRHDIKWKRPMSEEDDDEDYQEDFFESPVKTKPLLSSPVYKVWYENRAWVSSVAYLNALHNIFLRENLPPGFNKSEYGITLTTHPMNLTKSQSSKESLKTAGLGVIHAVCVIFALSFVPASFTVYLIEERKSGGKHLHLVSGVKPITYWIANFLYDLLKYMVPAFLCVLLFVIFNAKAYIGAPSILSFICLLLLYGWASIPAMYPFSFCFSVPSTAFVVLACMNLFIGVMSTVSTFVLEQFGDEELERIGNILKQVFLVFPHYCLGRGLIELVRLDMETIAYNRLGITEIEPKNRFEWNHLGKMLFFLSIHGLGFFLLNICLEYRQVCYFLFKKIRPALPANDDEDEDVKKERLRVISNPHMNCTLRAENLTKYYNGKKHPAVNGITFAIERGECFGLLGVNGAGKTSCFKMLTGDVRITCGRAKICDSDVETNLDSARKHFGYCPQEDGLDPLLDAFEVLKLYGRLRGMTASESRVAADKLVQTLGLSKYAKRRCGTYSGGNRRKLSTAIALIGDPDVVFLDEPTTGMDPVSRRKFWKVILRLVRIGKSVVLTSHSMEECEALTTRLAIMVNGQFTCLGSLQHLKNRFGDGYTVTLRCPKEKQTELLARIQNVLHSARLEDRHCSQLKFTIAQQDSDLGGIFNTLYIIREEGLIEDYSVSQTTLDDIFVKFASNQCDEMDR